MYAETWQFEIIFGLDSRWIDSGYLIADSWIFYFRDLFLFYLFYPLRWK